FGAEATHIQSFIFRLICSNGMTRRECLTRSGPRARKLSIEHPNAHVLQLNQVKRLAAEVWQSIDPKLQALKPLTQSVVDVPQLITRWLLRARISTGTQMMDRLLGAWHAEGDENTTFGAVNAITRVATHAPDLTARQRHVLSALAGLMAFE